MSEELGDINVQRLSWLQILIKMFCYGLLILNYIRNFHIFYGDIIKYVDSRLGIVRICCALKNRRASDAHIGLTDDTYSHNSAHFHPFCIFDIILVISLHILALSNKFQPAGKAVGRCMGTSFRTTFSGGITIRS